MSSQAAKTRPLPRFGEWDVNNPASADGFTVIFNKAREQKKANGTAAGGGVTAQTTNNNAAHNNEDNRHHSTPRKWLCCFYSA